MDLSLPKPFSNIPLVIKFTSFPKCKKYSSSCLTVQPVPYIHTSLVEQFIILMLLERWKKCLSNLASAPRSLEMQISVFFHANCNVAY